MAKTSEQLAPAKKPEQQNNIKPFTVALLGSAIATVLILLLISVSGISVSGVPQWSSPPFTLSFWIILILIFALILALIMFLYKGYTSWSLWTGFGEPTSPSSAVVADDEVIDKFDTEQTRSHQRKTLWDWQQLLIIPLLLGVGALWFNAQQQWNNQQLSSQQHTSDQRIAMDQQQEMVLEGYLDHMSDLLLNPAYKLSESKPGDEVRQVARARTLAALRSLDPMRKGILLRFLYEAALINGNNPIISLKLADLSNIKLDSAQLPDVNLSGADLNHAHLMDADLSRATLSGADLTRADLTGATLINAYLNNNASLSLGGAILSYAILRQANLTDADLNKAHLDNASLDDARLSHAKLNDADLYAAKLTAANLSYATLFIANLGSAQLDYSVLNQTCFGHADLNNANLSYANFSDANLNQADLNHANLSQANLSSAMLIRADLGQANLSSAILNHADISGDTVPLEQLGKAHQPILGLLRNSKKVQSCM